MGNIYNLHLDTKLETLLQLGTTVVKQSNEIFLWVFFYRHFVLILPFNLRESIQVPLLTLKRF